MPRQVGGLQIRCLLKLLVFAFEDKSSSKLSVLSYSNNAPDIVLPFRSMYQRLEFNIVNSINRDFLADPLFRFPIHLRRQFLKSILHDLDICFRIGVLAWKPVLSNLHQGVSGDDFDPYARVRERKLRQLRKLSGPPFWLGDTGRPKFSSPLEFRQMNIPRRAGWDSHPMQASMQMNGGPTRFLSGVSSLCSTLLGQLGFRFLLS
jgi:hypothetical protein